MEPANNQLLQAHPVNVDQVLKDEWVVVEQDEKKRFFDVTAVRDDVAMVENYAHNQITVEEHRTPEEQKRLLSDIRSYVREDSPADRLSNKKLKAREAAMAKKRGLRNSALELIATTDKSYVRGLDNANTKAAENGFKFVNTPDGMTLESIEGARQTEEVKDKWIKDNLNKLDASDIVCTNYDTDAQFVELYPYFRAQLDGAFRLEAFLKDEYLKKYVGDGAVPKVKKELQAKIAKYRKLSEYIELKITLIRNPYYMMLSKDDLGELTADELEHKSLFYEKIGRAKLTEYTQTLAALKRLEKQGISRSDIVPDSMLGRKNVSVSRDSVGNKTVTVKSKDVLSVDSKTVWYGKTGYMDGEHSNPLLSKKTDIDYEMLKYDPTISEIETTDYSKKSQLLDGLGIGITRMDETSVVRGRIVSKKDIFGASATGNASGHVGKLATRGSIGCGLTTKGHLAPGVNAAFGLEGTILEGNAGASLEKKAGPLTLAGGFANASGKVLTTDISFMGRVGKFNRIKANPNQQDPENADIGISLGMDAKAYLVHGKVEGGFKLLGVTFKGIAQGGVGAEASAAFVATTGKVMFGLGAALGIGGSLNVEINYSELTNVVVGALKKTGSTIAGLIKRKVTDRGAHKDSKMNFFSKIEDEAGEIARQSKLEWQQLQRERKNKIMRQKAQAKAAAKAEEKQKIKEENERIKIPPQMTNLWTRYGMLHA